MDVSGSGKYDLLVSYIDNVAGENHCYYRIGWDLNGNGDPTGWSNPKPVPGWFGDENQGLGVSGFRYFGDNALAVAHIDNPDGENRLYIRLTSLDKRGNTLQGWSAQQWLNGPSGVGWETAGGGIAVANISGRNRPDLLTYYINDAQGENTGYYFLSEALVGVP